MRAQNEKGFKNPDNTADLKASLTLNELLNISYTGPATHVQDTPIMEIHVSELELKNNTASRVVFENARHMFLDRQHDLDTSPMIRGRKIRYIVESEFNDGSYNVIIEWPELMPRTNKPFCKTFNFSCSCEAYAKFGPKFCKHIVFIVMKYLNYG